MCRRRGVEAKPLYVSRLQLWVHKPLEDVSLCHWRHHRLGWKPEHQEPDSEEPRIHRCILLSRSAGGPTSRLLFGVFGSSKRLRSHDRRTLIRSSEASPPMKRPDRFVCLSKTFEAVFHWTDLAGGTVHSNHSPAEILVLVACMMVRFPTMSMPKRLDRYPIFVRLASKNRMGNHRRRYWSKSSDCPNHILHWEVALSTCLR